jgi:hypothetical protein
MPSTRPSAPGKADGRAVTQLPLILGSAMTDPDETAGAAEIIAAEAPVRPFSVRAAVILVLGVAIAGVLGALLLSISHAPKPHHITLGYVGSATGRAQLQSSAGSALEHLDTYGALVTTGSTPQLFIATAAAPQVANILKAYAAALPTPASVTDLVPLPSDDSGGGATAVLVQVAVLAGTIGSLGLGRVLPGYRANFAKREAPVLFLIIYAFVIGLGVAGIGAAFGVGSGAGFWPRALALSLLNLAVTASLSALVALIGAAGSAVGGLLYFLLGIPISGAATALPMLPPPWKAFGQALPPGAGASLVRRVLYFHDAGVGGPIAVLVIYAAVGSVVLLTINAVGYVRSRASVTGLA